MADDDNARTERMGGIIVAGTFMALAIVVSMVHMVRHGRHYRRPDTQKLIIRIMLMVPVYATFSFLSLCFLEASVYFDCVREIYEAYVLYTFLALMEVYIGGETVIRSALLRKDPMPHLFPFNYCFRPIMVSRPTFHLRLRQGVLQLVMLKPVLAIITVICEATGTYYDGHLRFDGAYIYVASFYNVSIFISMYCLVLFYQVLKKELEPHKPFIKFMCIKFVIFFSFWQGVILSIMSVAGALPPTGGYSSDDIVVSIQNILICIEMFIAAILHGFAYGSREYREMMSTKMPFRAAVKDTLHAVVDVVDDTKATFHPQAASATRRYGRVDRDRDINFEDDVDMVDDDDDGQDIGEARRKSGAFAERSFAEDETDETTKLL